MTREPGVHSTPASPARRLRALRRRSSSARAGRGARAFSHSTVGSSSPTSTWNPAARSSSATASVVRPGSEVDAGERRRLTDDAGRDPLRLDPKRGGEARARSSPAAARRGRCRSASARRRPSPTRAAGASVERCLELWRFRRDPEHVDVPVELGGGSSTSASKSPSTALSTRMRDGCLASVSGLRRRTTSLPALARPPPSRPPIPPAPRIACCMGDLKSRAFP